MSQLGSLSNHLSTLLDQATNQFQNPVDIVEYCAPHLNRLIMNQPEEVHSLLNQLAWPNEHSETYTRQRLLEAPSGAWSVYAICWNPGQYTPIHDHGTWGVVGVLEGALYEHQYACSVQTVKESSCYQLTPTGVTLLSKGAVNTFIPEPDHIHRSGVPVSGKPTASIHLYGRLMTHYYAYDQTSGIRTRLDVE